jgi:hypothetical protein
MRKTSRPLVILPTYNERDNLTQLVPEILRTDSRLHILVVDDASPDGTALAVQQMMSEIPGNRLFLEMRLGKLGLAGAYVHGFKWGLARGYDFFDRDGCGLEPPTQISERSAGIGARGWVCDWVPLHSGRRHSELGTGPTRALAVDTLAGCWESELPTSLAGLTAGTLT